VILDSALARLLQPVVDCRLSSSEPSVANPSEPSRLGSRQPSSAITDTTSIPSEPPDGLGTCLSSSALSQLGSRPPSSVVGCRLSSSEPSRLDSRLSPSIDGAFYGLDADHGIDMVTEVLIPSNPEATMDPLDGENLPEDARDNQVKPSEPSRLGYHVSSSAVVDCCHYINDAVVAADPNYASSQEVKTRSESSRLG
jgi:hypothetical protein